MKNNKAKTTKAKKPLTNEERIVTAIDAMADAFGECIEEVAKKFGYTVDFVDVCVGILTGKKDGVPTTDKIRIPKKVSDQCKPEKKNGLSLDEAKKVLTLRKAGKSIKEIAKIIHRRDRVVSAFLKRK